MEGEEDKRRGGEEAREWADRGPQGIWSDDQEGFLRSEYGGKEYICVT